MIGTLYTPVTVSVGQLTALIWLPTRQPAILASDWLTTTWLALAGQRPVITRCAQKLLRQTRRKGSTCDSTPVADSIETAGGANTRWLDAAPRSLSRSAASSLCSVGSVPATGP